MIHKLRILIAVFLAMNLFAATVKGEALQKESSSFLKESNPGAELDTITNLLKFRLGTDKVSQPQKTPVKNIFQIQFSEKIAYINQSGRYLFMANLIDLEQGHNLTNLAVTNKEAPPDKPIVKPNSGDNKKSEMTHFLKLRLSSNNVSEPVETPVADIYRVKFGFNFAYLSIDGRYGFMGNLIDLEKGINMTDLLKRDTAKNELLSFADIDKAVFPAQGTEKAVVNVFTDTSCVSCKKMFTEVPKLQAAGITVQYLPFPDDGKKGDGYQTLKQVWCSTDKAQALSIGKGFEKGDLPEGNCPDAKLVDVSHELGSSIGVIGTPAIFKASGEQIKGYVPYSKLIPKILKN